MAGDFNTTVDGELFEDDIVQAVWDKASPVPGQTDQRRDVCGRLIQRDKYGDPKSDMGWEVDHKKPKARGGDDTLENLQPLQWALNRKKGDTWPWKCPTPGKI